MRIFGSHAIQCTAAQVNPNEAMAAWQELLKTNPNHPKRAQVEALLAQAEQHLQIPMARNE
jgi:cytochrome c-type biogenesis protein CcmH/NrfG